MENIHPTAIIEKGAILHKTVQVGPYCTVGAHVTLGKGTRLISHVVIEGHTTLGEDNIVYPFASLGQPSPDRKYKGEDSRLEIGDRNDIREYVTMHIGTSADRNCTSVGNDNLFMATSHIAHDCMIANNCVLANAANLAGHVVVEDYAIIGGLTGIHQHVRIGRYAFVGGHIGVMHDVPPFTLTTGSNAVLKGLNLIGLRRHGFSRNDIKALSKAFSHLFSNKGDLTLKARAIEIKKLFAGDAHVAELMDFMAHSERGITDVDEG